MKGWSAIACLLLPVLALAGPREDYAQQWPLTLGRNDAGAYRVTLDASVYRQLRDPALRDLVVFNRDNVAVPTSLFAPQQPLARPASRLAVPWFALPASSGAPGVRGWELLSQTDTDGRLSRVEARITDSAVAQLPRSALLVDVSHVREAIAALELQWQPLDALDLGYRVEASDDLEHWQVLPSRGRMVDLQREGRRLLHRRIELYGLLPHYQQARYLRLTPDRSDQPLTITGVFIEPVAARAVAAPQWLTVAGRRVEPQGGATFEFAIDGRFPVAQVDVELDGTHAVEWRLESRDDDESGWRLRAGPWVAYQLDPRSSDTRSTARQLSHNVRDKYWRLRANGPVVGEPKLRLGYQPEVVVFLAQGNAPYALAAGSSQARRASAPLPQMVGELRRQRGEQWQPSPAYLGAAKPLAGERAVQPQRDWKAWLLWGVLGMGALLVGGFALSLLRSPKIEGESASDAGAQ